MSKPRGPHDEMSPNYQRMDQSRVMERAMMEQLREMSSAHKKERRKMENEIARLKHENAELKEQIAGLEGMVCRCSRPTDGCTDEC